jgi:hypothetical protein
MGLVWGVSIGGRKAYLCEDAVRGYDAGADEEAKGHD